MKWLHTFAFFCLLGTGQLSAQLNLQVGNGDVISPSSPAAPNSPVFQSSLLPSYVQENPLGYSYLCRLELEIEEKLPVGVWMKIGEPSMQSNFEGLARQNAYVRFKLLRF